MESTSAKKSWYDRAIDFAFSSDPRRYLILFLVLGFVLRLIVANNVAPLADEMIHGTNAINIISSGVINAQNEAPAWLYLTDIFYRIFGVHSFSARFLSILFGTLTILVVYLLGKQLFNEKIGLTAAFLMAISAYYIRYTLMEMDQAMMFFVLLALYYFLKEIEAHKKIPYISGILMGIALLIKPITLPFIVSFGVCFFIALYKSGNRATFFSKNKIRICYVLLTLFLFATPILSYNYILYHQKGITDVIFSRFLGINQDIYAGLQGYDKSFVLSEVVSLGIPALFNAYWSLDPAIFILGLLGLVLLITTTKYRKARILLWFNLVPLIFLLGTSLLQTHLSVFVPTFCLLAAFFIVSTTDYFSSGQNMKKLMYGLLILVLIVNMYLLLPNLTSKAAMFKLRDYSINNIGTNDLVVVDSRVYRGRIAWTLNDKAYLESTNLEELLTLNENLSGAKIPTIIYFIECVSDDCGWGTIKDQQEFNKSMEGIVDLFKQSSQEIVTFNGGGGYDEETGKPTLRVYKGMISLNPSVLQAVYSTHDWFYYPVRWEKADWYDKYVPEGFFQTVFNLIGKLFLWLAIILSFVYAYKVFKETFS